MKLLRASWFFSKWCAGCLRDILLAALWFCLIALVLAQLAILTAHQLPMPAWMLRQIENRLTAAGLHLKIESARIDPTGRVLINNLQLTPTSFDSPLVVIDTLYLRLSPLALLAREIDPHYIRASGVNFLLPAMLSPTGRTEPVVSNVYLSLKPDKDTFELEQLSGQIGNLTLLARGTLAIGGFNLDPHQRTNLPALTTKAIKQYIEFARQVSILIPELASLEKPHLNLRLTSKDNTPPALALSLSSRKAEIDLSRLHPEIGRLNLTDLHLATTLALTGKAPVKFKLQGSCAEAHTTKGHQLQATRFTLTGKLSPTPTTFKPLSLVATVDAAKVNNIALKHALVRLGSGRAESTVSAELITEAIGTSWELQADADPKLGQGTLTLDGAITPEIVSQIEEKTGMQPGLLLRLKAPAPLTLTTEFADGWKPLNARGRVAFGPVVGYRVPFTAGRANFTFDGTELSITDIAASSGENAATGSYWMNVKNRDFRFLLAGHLRPIDISGFFEPWWPRFWSHFDFSTAAPDASVDVAGRWGNPIGTTVFVNADVDSPSINHIPFDRVRTTMFIRPDFYDALNFTITNGNRSAQGTFTRAVDYYRHQDSLRSLDFNLTSNLDLAKTAKIFGTEGTETVEPFYFANPPTLHLLGHIDGAASAKGPHRLIQIGAKSTGAFALYDFPLTDLSFNGTIKDDDIDLKDIEVTFARGKTTGQALISGTGAQRQLSFDGTLSNASLGEAINTLEQFSAKQRGEPVTSSSKFQQKVAQVDLNLKLSAKGLYHDPLSFQGQGNLHLSGAQLAQINLLGALSQLLNKSSLLDFTSIQLKEANANFTLDREKLLLPDLKITGTTLVIDTKGTYQLDKKTVDFAAKVYPFAKGKTLLADAVGFVLMPLTTVLELKLSGPLDQPNWRFAYGPTSLIYSLTGTKPSDEPLPDPTPTDITHRLPPPYLQR